jgi:geranylgeranyl diphosphate synthase type II
MIEFKTSVLLGCCLQLGAILGGASTEDQKHLYEFGLKFGLSFQIKDDYLDTFGEGDKVGKKIGGDILQNKKTYLYINAWSKASEEQKGELRDLLHESNEAVKIKGVKEIFDITGARQHTLDTADKFYKTALESLKKISASPKSKKPLEILAEKINNRDF